MRSYKICNTAVGTSLLKPKNIKKRKFKYIQYSTYRGRLRDKEINNGDTNVKKGKKK